MSAATSHNTTPAPWMLHPQTEAIEEREGAHPVDAGVDYVRTVEQWRSTPLADHLPRQRLRVSVFAFVNDNAPREAPTVSVHEDNVPQIDVTAADARRLGLALLQAAELIERSTAASWRSGRQSAVWYRCADLVTHTADTQGHLERIVSAVVALRQAGRIHLVIPWEVRTFQAGHTGRSGPHRSRQPRSPPPRHGKRQHMSAAVMSWDTPYPDDDPPSYVGLCVSYVPSRGDHRGARYLHVVADGPQGDAYLDGAAVRRLIGELFRLAADL